MNTSWHWAGSEALYGFIGVLIMLIWHPCHNFSHLFYSYLIWRREKRVLEIRWRGIYTQGQEIPEYWLVSFHVIWSYQSGEEQSTTLRRWRRRQNGSGFKGGTSGVSRMPLGHRLRLDQPQLCRLEEGVCCKTPGYNTDDVSKFVH